MQYRDITDKKLRVSLLGFGCMRFPTNSDNISDINENEATNMLRYAIDNGVNYIDTAWPYHGEASEPFVGRALMDGYREKVFLATKNPVWLVENHEDFEKYLDQQLVKLQTDYIDFYLLHALHKESWEKIVSLKVFDFVEKAKNSGKVKSIGFSFHDELSLFKEIIDSYPWDFCQIQLNYIDREYQAGLEGLAYAHSKGIDVIVMEPIKGGKLGVAPKALKDEFNALEYPASPAAWALRWVAEQKGVKVILSGMSTLEQVKENIETLSIEAPLNNYELNAIDNATKVYKDRIKVGCTACEYCLPCPAGVAIPNVFTLYNNAFVFEEEDKSKEAYKKMIKNNKDASLCVECSACEEICPQNLSVIKDLKEADKYLR